MPILVSNDAVGSLAASINDTVLTLALASGQGALFPVPGAGEFYYVTLVRASDGAKEIVRVTARSSDTLTIVRAQDGTTAKSFATSDRVELRPIRAIHLNYPQLDKANTFVGNQTVTGTITASGAISGASVAASGALSGASASVSGTVSAGALTASGAVSGGSASISGTVTAGAVTTSGTMTAANASVSGTVTAADLTATDDLVVGDDASISGDLTVGGALTVAGAILMSSRKVDAFPAGTKVVFNQTSAPTGWTKDTSHDNKALRLTNGTVGTGGSMAFTSAFANPRSFTLSEANLPSHRHYTEGWTGGQSADHTHTTTFERAQCDDTNEQTTLVPSGQGELSSTNIGSGGTSNDHQHYFAAWSTFVGSNSAVNLQFDVQYVDVIICTKDA